MIARSELQELVTGVYRTGSEHLSYIINSHLVTPVFMYTINAV